MPQAFLVVGHSHWGKSTTLRALTGSARIKKIVIDGKGFFVRKMSNDDKPRDYSDFISNLDPTKKPLVIMAYCPETVLINALAKKYELFFWILEHKFDDTTSISASEIEALRALGHVECYSHRRTSGAIRGAALTDFIRANVAP